MGLFHSNKFAARDAWEQCEGVVRHQPWCVQKNRRTMEAYRAVFEGLKESDEIRLAGLSVVWEKEKK